MDTGQRTMEKDTPCPTFEGLDAYHLGGTMETLLFWIIVPNFVCTGTVDLKKCHVYRMSKIVIHKFLNPVMRSSGSDKLITERYSFPHFRSSQPKVNLWHIFHPSHHMSGPAPKPPTTPHLTSSLPCKLSGYRPTANTAVCRRIAGSLGSDLPAKISFIINNKQPISRESFITCTKKLPIISTRNRSDHTYYIQYSDL